MTTNDSPIDLLSSETTERVIADSVRSLLRAHQGNRTATARTLTKAGYKTSESMVRHWAEGRYSAKTLFVIVAYLARQPPLFVPKDE